MAKRKVIWSHRARIKRYEILQYYLERNKSNIYPKKLNDRINKAIRLLVKFPDLGIKTDIEGVRGLIIDNYILFYEVTEELIIVHYIWDTRQDPDNLTIK